MSIGIIAAETEEMFAIKDIMQNINEEKIYNLIFIKGEINHKKCILTKCGVGKVNAARVAQIMIDKFDIEKIINVGSGAGLSNNLDVGDVVIGEKLVQYDFDITGARKLSKR